MFLARCTRRLALVGLLAVQPSVSHTAAPATVLFDNAPRPAANFLSPDGHRVLSIDGGTPVVLDVASRHRIPLPQLDRFEGDIGHVSWGEDGTVLYVRRSSGGLYRVPLVPGQGSFRIELPNVASWTILRSGKDEAPFLVARGRSASARGTHIYRCSIDVRKEEVAGCNGIAHNVASNATVFMSTDGSIAGLDYSSPSGSYDFHLLRSGAPVRTPVSFDAGNLGRLLSPMDANGQAWALSNRGRETMALVSVDMATGHEKVHFQHPEFDIAFVILDRSQVPRPVAAFYYDAYQQIEFFDERARRTFGKLFQEIGRPSKISLISQDRTANRVTVEAISRRVARAVYLLDFEAESFFRIASSPLEEYADELLLTQPVTIPSRNGDEVYAYLTVPDGYEEGERFPAVITIHGGPMERIVWSITRPAQFLAGHGYGVLALNYRGSEGYGRQYLNAGYGRPRFQAMVDDIEDAADWLNSQGYAETGQVALAGGSFGGLLALLALRRGEGRYAGGVLINPIVDAPNYWKEEWQVPRQRNLWQEYLKSEDYPQSDMEAISPLNWYRELRSPVLFLLGENDRRVPVGGAHQLHELLWGKGATTKLVSYKGVGHDIWRAHPQTLVHMHERMLKFLYAQLPIETR